MPLSDRDLMKLRTHLSQALNLQYIKGQLSLGRAKPISTKHENFEELKWWLKSSQLIMTDDAGVRQVADLIQTMSGQPPAIIETSPPPMLDVAKEKKKITDDCAHAATIRGIYVQLDTAQNKHQPREVPIGTRAIHGEKFGVYATKQWHETHTMDYMATWAASQVGMVEGKRVEHGQATRHQIDGVGPVSFEAFCVMLGGMKYVSFHCYPNTR